MNLFPHMKFQVKDHFKFHTMQCNGSYDKLPRYLAIPVNIFLASPTSQLIIVELLDPCEVVRQPVLQHGQGQV